MKNRIRSLLLSGLLILTLLSCAAPFSAADAPCRLTLCCTVTENGSETAVAGDTFAVVKIADCAIHKTEDEYSPVYTTVQRFKSFDIDWTALSSSGVRELAADLAAAADREDYLDIKTTDRSGTAVFSLRDAGIYLVVRTRAADADITFEPMIISVPQIFNGELMYDVTAYPKFGNRHSAPSDNGGRLPQTGRIFLPIVLFAAVGVPAICAGVWLILSSKRHEEDDT